jgi:tRNA (guanine6-N2)-methyltransferase
MRDCAGEHWLLRFVGRTVRGIEWIAAAEIDQVPNTSGVALAHREVRFDAPRSAAASLLQLGVCDDVLIEWLAVDDRGRHRSTLSGVAAAVHQADLGATLAVVQSLRSVPRRPRFDVTGSFLGRRNFSRFELEQAVGVGITRHLGWSFVARTAEGLTGPTDVSVRIHLDGQVARLSLRLGDRPLHRRAYRLGTRSASLRPTVARAAALLGGLGSGRAMLDPFCGAGTIPIEARLAAPQTSAMGYDVDPAAVALARENAQRAGTAVEFQVGSASEVPVGRTFDAIVTNPPWNRNVRLQGNADHTWRAVRRRLVEGGRLVLLAPEGASPDIAAAFALPINLQQPLRVAGQIVALVVAGDLPDDTMVFGPQLRLRWPDGRSV